MWFRRRVPRVPTDEEVPISYEEEWQQEPWASRPYREEVNPPEVCPFCGKSRFIHSGIQIPKSARECWDTRAAVAMLRPDEIGRRPS